MNIKVSIIIPAKNEGDSLNTLLPDIKTLGPEWEIIVVNDGSTDNTSRVCQQYGIVEIVHPYSKGNGAAIKSGARAALGETLVFLDGDGQHQAKNIVDLLERLDQGYDMVIGARDNASQASFGRLAANKLYNNLAGWMVGNKIPDLTSGFRAVKATKFKEFLSLLPNGFSYPTTITMAFFRAGYSVGYRSIEIDKRKGASHINIARDGIRFLLIIFKVGTLYSPIRIFFPFSLVLFSMGLAYYGYTYFTAGRFTNMGLLLFTTSLIVFLMGLISEQITALMYSNKR